MTHLCDIDVTVAAINVKRGGFRDGKHDFSGVMEMATGLCDKAPDILVLSEATGYRLYDDAPKWELTRLLNEWADHPFYPFLTESTTSRNSPGLWVAPWLTIGSFCTPPSPGHPLPPREIFHNTLTLSIGATPAIVKPIHWTGSRGPAGFEMQAALDSQLAAKATILAGDFNTISSADIPYLPADWFECQAPHKWLQKAYRDSDGEWHLNVRPLDTLLESGYWDAGQEAGDFTPTVSSAADGGSGLRIDRIMVSDVSGASLVPGSYVVGPESPSSDHRGVRATIRFPA